MMINLSKLAVNIGFIILLFVTAMPVIAEDVTSKQQNTDASEYQRTTATYSLPKVTVVRRDAKKLSITEVLADDRPVVMNFIFASCSAICPMLSHTFSQLQAITKKAEQNVHLVSISIDPENDTPTVLSEYAKKFGADANWDFYTGSVESSLAIQKAFNVYRGDKMNHASVILIRKGPNQPWIRLEGFVTADNIIQEFKTKK